MRNLKITVIRELCIAAGTCLIHAPNTFDLDGDNIAIIKDPVGDTASAIIAAAKSCPTVAILIEDADTGEKIWPKET
ncbi:MAG: ferredoxin [Patescibacteria group bacterium]